jgi:predicted ATPase
MGAAHPAHPAASLGPGHLEDLHWADASTLEFIQLLSEQAATARLVLLSTARPEFHPQRPMMAHHAQITLNRLSPRHVREIIAQVAARDVLTRETVDTVSSAPGAYHRLSKK